MSENQNIEYKESWRDEYLKWICGFANAQGGTIYVGIDDSGNVKGLKNVKRLLEDIPNKIQAGLGIVADVNMLSKDGLDYIEIKVLPSSFPVSYHGEYHYRSGATKQQLTGIALSQFILRKAGLYWEDGYVDNLSVSDLDAESFKIFRREALQSKRMKKKELDISNEELLKKLHLMEDGKLKRSAVLLFYHDPSIVQAGICVRIGKFNEREVVYQDELDGSLIVIADRVVELIFLKYLKAKISYERDIRVETYPFEREAVREAVYNALVHNCYMFGTPIQIRVEEEAIIISNRCVLPEGWTAETLTQTHESIPYNPNIAKTFYLAGFIETWGQGIKKICDCCRSIGAEIPTFEVRGSGLRVHFPALQSALFKASDVPIPPAVSSSANLDVRKESDDIAFNPAIKDKIIDMLKSDPYITVDQMASQSGIAKRSLSRYLRTLKEKQLIKRTGGRRYGRWIVTDE